MAEVKEQETKIVKPRSENVKRNVKLRVLREIIIDGKQRRVGEEVLASEEEAKMFSKPIVSKYEGWGEGMFRKNKIIRAERV